MKSSNCLTQRIIRQKKSFPKKFSVFNNLSFLLSILGKLYIFSTRLSNILHQRVRVNSYQFGIMCQGKGASSSCRERTRCQVNSSKISIASSRAVNRPPPALGCIAAESLYLQFNHLQRYNQSSLVIAFHQ